VAVEDLAEEYVLGRLPVERLPGLATEFLVAGADTDEMAAAAMPDGNDPRETRELFEAALGSLGVELLPAWEIAARRWLIRRAIAALIGEATLADVARDVCETFGWPGDAEQLPEAFQDVVIIAGEDIEPWWRDAFRNALNDLVRAAQ
jgi:hypothetical protein